MAGSLLENRAASPQGIWIVGFPASISRAPLRSRSINLPLSSPRPLPNQREQYKSVSLHLIVGWQADIAIQRYAGLIKTVAFARPLVSVPAGQPSGIASEQMSGIDRNLQAPSAVEKRGHERTNSTLGI